MTSTGLRSAVPALLSGEIDAAYARVTGLDDPRLDHTPAYLEPVYALVGSRHPLAHRQHVRTSALDGVRAWMPGNAPGSEWAEFWDEFGERFGISYDTGRTFFGMDHLFDEIARSADLLTFVGEGTPTQIPWHLDIVRLAVIEPVPVYPLSLLWNRASRHPLLPELVVHTRTNYRPNPGEPWLPDEDRAALRGGRDYGAVVDDPPEPRRATSEGRRP